MATKMVLAHGCRGQEMTPVDMATAITTPKALKAWAQMKGDSMAPGITAGQWVEVDPEVTAFAGPGVYLTAWKNFKPSRVCPRDIPQLRRLGYIGGILHSIHDNSSFPPFEVDIADLVFGGKAVGR